MIDDKRIKTECETAVDSLNAIINDFDCQGGTFPKYLHEKASRVKYIAEFLLSFCEE